MKISENAHEYTEAFVVHAHSYKLQGDLDPNRLHVLDMSTDERVYTFDTAQGIVHWYEDGQRQAKIGKRNMNRALRYIRMAQDERTAAKIQQLKAEGKIDRQGHLVG